MIIHGDVARRFWAKARTGPISECWPWAKGRSIQGYGCFHPPKSLGMNKNPKPAHRIAYLLAFGEIPGGLFVCHRCDNPPCVNPSHLFVGTHTENMQDMLRKGRNNYVGPTINSASRKLTVEQVREIRRRYASGEANTIQLGREYGVDNSTIYRLIHRETYWWVS